MGNGRGALLPAIGGGVSAVRAADQRRALARVAQGQKAKADADELDAANKTRAALISKGVPEGVVDAAIANPAIMKQLLPGVFKVPDSKVHEVDGRLVRVGPDGKAEQIYGPDLGDTNSQESLVSLYGKPPNGYRWSGGKPGELEAIPGGPATKLSGEAAAKVGMMRATRVTLPQIRDIFLGAEGESGTRPGGQDNIVGYYAEAGITGEGVRLIRGGVETVLRAASGAAVPETEVERYERLFVPKPYDTQPTRERKLDAFERWMANIELAVNQGRFISQDDALKLAEGAKAGIKKADPGAISEARDAIKRGAPRDKVIEELRLDGIDTSGL